MRWTPDQTVQVQVLAGALCGSALYSTCINGYQRFTAGGNPAMDGIAYHPGE